MDKLCTKYSLGYQLRDEEDSIVSIVRDYRADICEVYFALPGQPSGRAPLGFASGGNESKVDRIFTEELAELSHMGIDLVLLFNANCYGDKATSSELRDQVKRQIDELLNHYNLVAVTTTSPFIARIIKQTFPQLECRASVNMRIGTVQAMVYLADYFDGFYLQREYNRDFDRIRELYEWCYSHGKKLHLLANSGCLRYCPFQTFHDNLVAHEANISNQKNVSMRYPSPCWEFMDQRENWHCFLQNTWIRPEDIKHYVPYFQTIKLATRMHASPRRVIAAYSAGRFYGNLLNLTEPSYNPLFAGNIIDNSLFPGDWFQRTTTCDKNCHSCDYCKNIFEKVCIKIDDSYQDLPRKTVNKSNKTSKHLENTSVI
jgi:collagenase-like PrtC family protease